MALRERFAILKDVQIEPSVQEFVVPMGQRKGLAVIKDAIMRLLIQVYVVGMAHRRKHAAMKDVPIIQKEMECAEGMVHISEGVLSVIPNMD